MLPSLISSVSATNIVISVLQQFMKTFCELSSKISFMYSVNNLFPVNFNTSANYHLCLKIFFAVSAQKLCTTYFTKKTKNSPSVFLADNKHFARFFLVPNMHYVTEEGDISHLKSGLMHFVISISYSILFMFPHVFFDSSFQDFL